MSLMRAFTTRRNKSAVSVSTEQHLGRAASQRAGRPILRAQISSPLALVSTSNIMLNNAHDIEGTSPIDCMINSISSASSAASSSGEDSDASNGSIHSNETVTDASSVDESPVRTEPEPNHLSCYFKPAVDTQTKSPSRSPSVSARQSMVDTPKIPQRVPSHSKRAHESLHRHNSIKRMLSPPPSAVREVVRDSAEIFYTPMSSFVEAPKENPFDNELAQLDEVAEDFGHVVRDAETSQDLVIMESWGLAQFAASDYLAEIQSMICDTFDDQPADVPCWI